MHPVRLGSLARRTYGGPPRLDHLPRRHRKFRALRPGRGNTEVMPGTEGAAYVVGPLLVAAVLGVLVLIARWATGQSPSLTEDTRSYGLLTPVASGISSDHIGALQQSLSSAGIRCTVAGVPGDYRLLVWPEDVARARRRLRQSGHLR